MGMTPKQQMLMGKFLDNCRMISGEIKSVSKSNSGVWGLDISLSNTGLTIYNSKNNSYNCYSHNKFKGSRYARLIQLEDSFSEHIVKYHPALVMMEGYAFGARQGREILGEASYAVKRCFLNKDQKYPCLTVAPLSLKKFVSGRAKGIDKKKIHKIVKEEWNAPSKNHDESDSFALCVLGQNIIEVCSMSLDISKKQYEDFYKGKMLEVEYFRWDVIRNVIIGDGKEITRFYE